MVEVYGFPVKEATAHQHTRVVIISTTVVKIVTNDQIRTEGKYEKKNDMEMLKNDEINDIKFFEKN